MNDIMNDDGHYPMKADIWAVGVSMYCFLTEELPFYNAEPVKMFQKQ
jgi:serine/threonine protein kinase